MKTKAEVRDEFHNMAVNVYGEDFALRLLEDFDKIMGDGVVVFELDGFSGIGWMVYRDGNEGWTWKSYETGEEDIYWGKHGSRAEAMMSAAADAEENVYDYVDSRIGDRIRAAI